MTTTKAKKRPKCDTRIVGEIGRGWYVERVLGYDQVRECVAVQLHNPTSNERWIDTKELHELRLITAEGEYLSAETLAAEIESRAVLVIDHDGDVQ